MKVNVVPDLDQDERLHNSPQLHQHSLSKHTLDSPHAIDLGHLCPTFPPHLPGHYKCCCLLLAAAYLSSTAVLPSFNPGILSALAISLILD